MEDIQNEINNIAAEPAQAPQVFPTFPMTFGNLSNRTKQNSEDNEAALAAIEDYAREKIRREIVGWGVGDSPWDRQPDDQDMNVEDRGKLDDDHGGVFEGKDGEDTMDIEENEMVGDGEDGDENEDGESGGRDAEGRDWYDMETFQENAERDAKLEEAVEEGLQKLLGHPSLDPTWTIRHQDAATENELATEADEDFVKTTTDDLLDLRHEDLMWHMHVYRVRGDLKSFKRELADALDLVLAFHPDLYAKDVTRMLLSEANRNFAYFKQWRKDNPKKGGAKQPEGDGGLQ